jgi:hypothetical protein
MTTKTLRTLLVWLHAVTSIGWLSQALALLALGLHARATPGVLPAAEAMAEFLDRRVLAQLANASAFTGFMLCALTPWGWFRSWWVMTKAVLTVVQLVLGIFVLSASPRAGMLPLVAGMIATLGLQAWLSMAKPWGRTPWARRPGTRRPPIGSRTAHAWALLVPWLDLGLATTGGGGPRPVLSLGTVLGYAALRARRLRRAGHTSGVPGFVTVE